MPTRTMASTATPATSARFSWRRRKTFAIASCTLFRDCVLYTEDDGRIVSASGQRIQSAPQAFQILQRECMRTGATVGANHIAKMQALEDVKAFLKTTLF